MTEQFIEEMRHRLLDLQSGMIEGLRDERAMYDQLGDDQEPKDTAGQAQYAYQRSRIADEGVMDQQRLRLIRGALDNIDNQRYGICSNCGREIAEERLEAIPWAQLCMTCRTNFENKGKGTPG